MTLRSELGKNGSGAQAVCVYVEVYWAVVYQ